MTAFQDSISDLNIPVFSAFQNNQNYYVSPRLKHLLVDDFDNGFTLTPHVHPDDQECLDNARLETLLTGKDSRIDHRFRVAGGGYHRMVGWHNAYTDPCGDITGVQMSFVDVGTVPENSIRINRPQHHKNAVPRLAFDLERVLVNTVQSVLDCAAEEGIPGYGDIMSWEEFHGPIPCMCDRCSYYLNNGPTITDDHDRNLFRALRRRPDVYLNAQPFPDIDFESLNAGANEDQYLLYFLGSWHQRRCGAMSHDWLKAHGITDHQGILPDFCQEDKVMFLRAANIDFFLTSHPELVLQTRAAGIKSFLIDRPWNRKLYNPFRVHSIDEFLMQAGYVSSTPEPCAAITF